MKGIKFIFALVCALTMAIAARAQDVTVIYNGQTVDMGNRGIITEAGRVFVPVETLAQMDADVSVGDDGRAQVRFGEKVMDIAAGDETSHGSIFMHYLDLEGGLGLDLFYVYADPLMIDGELYVPIRTISEGANRRVYWDSDENAVVILDFERINEEIVEAVPTLAELRRLRASEPPEVFTRTEELVEPGSVELRYTMSCDGENYYIITDTLVVRGDETFGGKSEFIFTSDSMYSKDIENFLAIIYPSTEHLNGLSPYGQWVRMPLSDFGDPDLSPVQTFLNSGFAFFFADECIDSMVAGVEDSFYDTCELLSDVTRPSAGMAQAAREIPGNIQSTIDAINNAITISTDYNGNETIKLNWAGTYTIELSLSDGKVAKSSGLYAENDVDTTLASTTEFTAEKIAVPTEYAELSDLVAMQN